MKTILRALLFLAVLAGVTYTAQAQQTMPLGLYGEVPTRTGNVSAGAATLTLVPGQMSELLTSTPTEAQATTTPTATLLCRLFPFSGAANANNFWWDWRVKNASAFTMTITGGTNVTVVGTATVLTLNVKMFRIVLTNCTGATPTAQVISLGTSLF
jgi:hypothetical protein